MQSRIKSFLVFLIILGGLAVASKHNSKPYSLSLADVSVTLSNSRLSFRGGLAAGNFEGTSRAIINTTPGDYPSTSSAELVEGDTVLIGSGGGLGTYTVASTSANDAIYLKSPDNALLQSGHADENDDVIATASSDLTVRFTTANALEGGRFRVLVPALTDDGASSDGIPDGGKFDFSSSTVTCPSDVSASGQAYDFVTGTATASTIAIAGNEYHSYECAYSGTGGSGTDFGTTYDAITISDVVNPAPAPGHSAGVADSHRIVVQHLDSSFAVVDQTTVAVGVIEAVKVTATVAPQITFKIIGVNNGTSVCGVTTNVTTTPVLVPFGELLIAGYTYAAHSLSVSTNALNGYSVTVQENDQLGREGGACGDGNTGTAGANDDVDSTTNNYTSCILDARGNTNGNPDGSSMSHTAHSIWDYNDSTYKGFGFSLDDANTSGLTAAFEYDSTSGNCSTNGTYGNRSCYRQFADEENNESAQQIFSGSQPADNHNLYVCYKAVIHPTQAAGDYENYLTYTATATF